MTPKKGNAAAGSKRKADTSTPKGSHKAARQTTIEESLAGDNTEDPPSNPDVETGMKENPGEDGDEKQDEEPAKPDTGPKGEPARAEDTNENSGGDDTKQTEPNDDPVQESSEREKNIASNILEKGIVYFFTRNRVNIEDSDGLNDLQRT
ncbi:hypothetical protein SLS60_010693 [Paraconiothyrium brasiliense]|uniref:Uncharacterized protein n=1 Tax=Paraconiothyrium brasiliense TaxID=300254 RepID=A0ABR3QP78_9PLEO